MSINEIVNYVNRTPHNTNPSVIASMVRSSNNQAVYESVEELKRNGGVGYTEKAKVLTFDGDTTGKESNGDMIKISGEYIDLERVTALSCFVFEYGEEVSVPVDELNVFEFLDGQILATLEDHFPYIAASTADNDIFTKGIYVFATADAYISRIEFAEAVHTIDSKYLPESSGGSLTVIELETEIGEDTTMLNEADIAKVSAAMVQRLPVVIRCNFMDGRISLMCHYIYIGDMQEGFYAICMQREFMFVNMAGAWAVVVQDV